MLPNDAMLLDELRAPQYTKNMRGKIVVSSKDVLYDRLKRSPDRASALCLTFTPIERAKVIKLDI